MTRFVLTLVSGGLIMSQVVAGAERCAQRIEQQQLNRAAQLVSVESPSTGAASAPRY